MWFSCDSWDSTENHFKQANPLQYPFLSYIIYISPSFKNNPFAPSFKKFPHGKIRSLFLAFVSPNRDTDGYSTILSMISCGIVRFFLTLKISESAV